MRTKSWMSLLLLGAAAVAAQAQGKGPTEAQCRTMVDGMLQTMRATPVEKGKPSPQPLIERAEKIVKDNRARGASECDSWTAIGKLVAHQ